MNKEEILNNYIKLIDKGYCSDCNELNCIGNFPHKDIAKAICNLQQENKILKENAEHNDKVVDKVNWENKYLKQENEQLHHKRFEILNFIEENKNKRYAPYGDNEDEDFEICLNEDEIDVLERIVRDEYDYES